MSNNPFTATSSSALFGSSIAKPSAFAAVEQAQAPAGPTGYAIVASGPAVDPSEIENAALASVEVTIAWGSSVLHVEHLTPPRTFLVGEAEGCDFTLPCDKLGAERAPLMLVDQGQVNVVLWSNAKGSVELPGQGRRSVEEVRESSQVRPCPAVAGAVMLPLPAAGRVRIEVGDLVLTVGSVAAGKKVRRAIFGAASVTGLMFAGLSLLGHASLLGGMAFFKPNLEGMDGESDRKEREVLMAQMLKASAEREQEEIKEETPTPDSAPGGTDGGQAKGPSGAMGSTVAKATGGKWAVKGSKENPDPHLSREQAREEASKFGLIGLLQASVGGEAHAPTAIWGRETAEGKDAVSAMGGMWGATLEDSAGAGGLGLFGTGAGSDGKYEGIGIGQINTLGGGKGMCKDGPCTGFGNTHGQVRGEHKVTSPQVRIGTSTVSGRLAPELIQRVVRQSFGRFRLCYENGLRTNSNLQGRVTVRFVIDSHGAVSSASNGGSDLPDSAVVSCVVRSFAGLSFPEPQGGIVTVVYPIAFAPGS